MPSAVRTGADGPAARRSAWRLRKSPACERRVARSGSRPSVPSRSDTTVGIDCACGVRSPVTSTRSFDRNDVCASRRIRSSVVVLPAPLRPAIAIARPSVTTAAACRTRPPAWSEALWKYSRTTRIRRTRAVGRAWEQSPYRTVTLEPSFDTSYAIPVSGSTRRSCADERYAGRRIGPESSAKASRSPAGTSPAGTRASDARRTAASAVSLPVAA